MFTSDLVKGGKDEDGQREGEGEGLGMLRVDSGGGSSTLGGMFPVRVGHNAPSVQAGPQELVLQQGRGGHQWPDDVNHPGPIHSDKQPPPSTAPPPPPPLFLLSPITSLLPSTHSVLLDQNQGSREYATAPQLNGLEVRVHTHTNTWTHILKISHIHNGHTCIHSCALTHTGTDPFCPSCPNDASSSSLKHELVLV